MQQPRHRAVLLGLVLAAAGAGCGAADTAGSAADDWFDEEPVAEVPQAAKGELLFLPPDYRGRMLHSENHLTITAESLRRGWVSLRQCYQGLDAVPDAEVVYRYRELRGLRIQSQRNIGEARAAQRSVLLSDVGQDASLCIDAEARILYVGKHGDFVLRNGPFNRRFLDGYFPLHVSLEVRWPAGALQYAGITPEPQPGFDVDTGAGRMTIDTRFAGSLNIEVRFNGTAAAGSADPP